MAIAMAIAMLQSFILCIKVSPCVALSCLALPCIHISHSFIVLKCLLALRCLVLSCLAFISHLLYLPNAMMHLCSFYRCSSRSDVFTSLFFCPVLSRHIMCCLVLSCLVLPCLVLSCDVLFYFVLFCMPHIQLFHFI